MEKLEIISLTPAELQKMISDSTEIAIKKVLDDQKRPSDYEDITIEQAADELKCSMRTIRRRMKELRINGFRVGKKIVLQRKDLKKIKQAS